MEVDEGAHAEQDEREPPARLHDGEEGDDGDGREDVALVDPRGQDEEGDGKEGQRHEDGPAVVAGGGSHDAPEVARGEQQRPHHHRRDGAQKTDAIRRPAQALRERRNPVGAQERPQIEGIDAEVAVLAGGTGHQAQIVDDAQAEGQREEMEGDDPGQQRCHDARPALAAVEPGSEYGRRPGRALRARSGSKQVALDEHGRDQRDEHDAELGLDHGRSRRQHGRPFAVATDEGGSSEEQHECTSSVSLAPQRRVVERDRVEEVERPCDERQALRSRCRPQPPHHQPIDDVGNGQIEHDRRQLDELCCQRRRPGSDDAEGPEQVQVGRRVVREARSRIEAGWPDLTQGQRPRSERPDVALEARGREEDVGDEQAQHEAGEQQDDEGRRHRQHAQSTWRRRTRVSHVVIVAGLRKERARPPRRRTHRASY